MENQNHESLTRLPLEEKIQHAKNVIIQAMEKFPGNRLVVAWTGGKDSTTMLWLYREACRSMNRPLPRAMFIDEGDVFDEIWELVDQVKNAWHVEVDVAKNSDVSEKADGLGSPIQVASLNERNRREIEKLGFADAAFPFEPESLVGNHLMKTVAMNTYLEDNGVRALSTAIRWDEQTARTLEDFFSPRSEPAHTRVQPILHFTERDIWDTIHNHRLPFCSLYYQGYRSLGARCSTTRVSDLPAWEQDLENTPERSGRGQEKEAIMDQLRSLGYM